MQQHAGITSREAPAVVDNYHKLYKRFKSFVVVLARTHFRNELTSNEMLSTYMWTVEMELSTPYRNLKDSYSQKPHNRWVDWDVEKKNS